MERTIRVASDIVGRPIVPLRLALRAVDAERRPTLIVVEATPIEMEAGDGTRWASLADVRDALQPPDLRATLAWWLDLGRDGSSEMRPPSWTRPGWFARASDWMVERMTRAGHPPDGPTRIVYMWPLSVVLCTPSPAGSAYLKSAAPVFAHEASITAQLAARTPDAVPEVLDVDPDDNWLLMRDLGGSVVGDEPATSWGDGLACLAGLQRAWAGSADELQLAGAQRRTLDGLAEGVPSFCDELRLGNRLDRQTRRAWSAATPRLTAACTALRDAGVPETLVHGDFHPWNVARTPRGLVVFDWSDSAIGHPFVDLVTTLARTDDVGVRRALADRYLEAWPEIAANDRAMGGRPGDGGRVAVPGGELSRDHGDPRPGRLGGSRGRRCLVGPARPGDARARRRGSAAALIGHQEKTTTWRAASPARRRSKASSRSPSGSRRSIRRSIGRRPVRNHSA